jgi:hypothetical protein
MKKVFYLVLILLCGLNQSVMYAQDEAQDKIEEINFTAKENSYINFIDSYVSHINLSSKDSDNFSEADQKSINAKKGFKNNTSKKRVIYRNNEIVKIKYTEILDHNFIKLKSFYYNNNHLIYIKVNELLPSNTKKVRTYQRALYFHNSKLLLDSNEKDKKYNDKFLLNLGQKKLQEEYQFELDD